MMRRIGVLLAAAAALAADPAPFTWRLPTWAPLPVVPTENAMSTAKVELGRHLFYDVRLSGDGTMACATCHQQARAFTDGKTRPAGITGALHSRNTMSLANIAYLPALTWANPELTSIEEQAKIPMLGTEPIEMGGDEGTIRARLAAEPRYAPLFNAAFGDARIDLDRIVKAIAAFQRTLLSVDSPYDRYKYGKDDAAISAAAKRGEAHFFSEKFECYHCHAGFNFTDNIRHSRLAFPEIGYHNNALYNVNAPGGYPPGHTGLAAFTQKIEDVGKFRTPSLRNVALTAPYMHDGSIATLEGVLSHYAAGGRTIHAGEHRGEGSKNPNKSGFMVGFELTKDEQADLVAFLESLTDRNFLTDPRFADPWAK